MRGPVTQRELPAWRDDDEALLHRLEDEVLIGRLWSVQAPKGATQLSERAAGLLRELRKLPGGSDSVEKASSGEVSELFPWLLAEPLRDRSPVFVHQLAVYFDRLASALEVLAESGSGDVEAFVRARVRSIAAWIALREEKTYLLTAASRILGTQLSPSELDAAVTSIAQACLEELGQVAREGARKLEPRARAALATLSRSDEACRIAGSDAKGRTMVVRRAESIRALAIDEALVPILDGLREAKLRDDGERTIAQLFEQVTRVWEWSGGDEAVERFAVDEVSGIAWTIYRTSRWDALRALLAPSLALYDSLAARIERDPKRHLAYAAKCAQIFVFRSECETDRPREWAFAERALNLCPSHRNGRLVMAHLCCDSAIRRLSVSFFPTGAEVERARYEVKRAEELFPQSKRLPEAHAKLREVIERAGGVYVP
jgi:hypothetical protein